MWPAFFSFRSLTSSPAASVWFLFNPRARLFSLCVRLRSVSLSFSCPSLSLSSCPSTLSLFTRALYFSLCFSACSPLLPSPYFVHRHTCLRLCFKDGQAPARVPNAHRGSSRKHPRHVSPATNWPLVRSVRKRIPVLFSREARHPQLSVRDQERLGSDLHRKCPPAHLHWQDRQIIRQRVGQDPHRRAHRKP